MRKYCIICIFLKICTSGDLPNFVVEFPHVIMSKKHQSRPDGLAYSTNKEFFGDYQEESYAANTLAKNQQKLRVSLDTRQRAGKVVTLVSGFVGTESDLEALGKQLKTKCGTGGSVKDGLIMVQGDYKQKIIGWLQEWGYSNTK